MLHLIVPNSGVFGSIFVNLNFEIGVYLRFNIGFFLLFRTFQFSKNCWNVIYNL
jgi:hypothetical protein